MLTMLEVEPEVASKIQARARERGVSVDVYLRELIDQKGTESERSNGSARKSGFACCENGRRATPFARRLFLKMRLVVNTCTKSVVSIL